MLIINESQELAWSHTLGETDLQFHSVFFLRFRARLDQQLDRWENNISEEFGKGNLSQGGFWMLACNYSCFSKVTRICSLDFHFHAQSLELQVPPVNTVQTQYN